MPTKNDLEMGGTNSDGGKSEDYCSYCYQNDSFYQPDMTAAEMQKFSIEKMKEKRGRSHWGAVDTKHPHAQTVEVGQGRATTAKRTCHHPIR